MSFAAPLWLIAWAAASGLVIWLHTHRPEQRDLRVPSLILWKRAAQRIQGDAKWRKLISNLLLALQLLALTALGAVLARPSFSFESSRRLEIVVLDTSASMGARQGPNGAVRLDAAKNRAVQLVESEHAPRVALITAGAKAQLALAPSSPAAFKQALGRAQSAAGPADWSDAADLVRTLIRRQENTRVSVITDGDFTAEEIAPLEAAAGALRVERVGSDLANVGLVAFSARQSGQSFADYQLLATVQNFGAAAVDVPLRITQGEQVLTERTLHLGPNAKDDVVLDYTYSGSAVVAA
ncbi:MAG TPA: BatA domain-containing protein, partial [Limnochordia bacterium]|nr:BatA domain-containing protein [Limnochordia bacterium]